MDTLKPVQRRTFLAATIAAATSVAAGCTFSDDSEDHSDGERLLRQSMAPITTFDPAISAGSGSGTIIEAALMEGLVIYDETGTDVAAGAAEKWTTSKDSLTYTFTIRANAKWSNGDSVTAHDFEWNWRRLLSPETSAANAGQGINSFSLQQVRVVGSMAFLNGEIDDFEKVGVKALDAATLSITLESPDPDFLFRLARFWALPLHPRTLDDNPEDWSSPGKWVSNGPFVLDSFRANSAAVLLPNEHYWDRDSYHLDRWEVQFNDGGVTADILSYTNNEIDVVRVEEDLAVVTNDPTLQDELVGSPPNQVAGMNLMTSWHPALHDVRVRKALSLAIDREQLAELEAPKVAGGTLVPGGVPGSDQISPARYNIDLARDLLEQAGYPGGDGMPTLSILLPQDVPWAEALTEMWRTNLGVKGAVDVVEPGVYATKRFEVHQGNYTGFFYQNLGVNPPTLYSSVTTVGPQWTAQAMPPQPTEDYRRIEKSDLPAVAKATKLQDIINKNLYPEFRRYISAVRSLRENTDPSAQTGLVKAAGIAREESYVFIPVLWGGYNLLVKPRVKNLTPWTVDSVFTTRNITIEGATDL